MKYRFAMERERLQREIMHLPIQSVGRRTKYKSALFLRRISDFCLICEIHATSSIIHLGRCTRSMSTQIPRVHTSADSLRRMANKHGNRSSAFQSRHRPFSSRFANRRSDVNTLLVRVAVDCVAAAWAGMRVRVGWRLRWGWFAPSLVRSLTRVVCSGNDGERQRPNGLHSRPPPIGADSVTNTIRAARILYFIL